MNLNVAVIMPPGAERESLQAYLERHHAAVVLADNVDQFLATRVEEACALGVLDFGSGRGGEDHGYPADRRDAVRRLKERWPKMQLALWLERDYKLSANESNVVLGTSVRYDIAEVVDPQFHIVAKIAKSVLAPLR